MKLKLIVTGACLLGSLLFSLRAAAFENFLNTLPPYPSGCVSYFMTQGLYPGGAETLVDGNIVINSTTEVSAVTARLTLYRSGCAETGRSVLWIALAILNDGDGTDEYGVVPTLWGIVGETQYPLRPTEEPSGWVSNDSGIGLAEGTMRYYVIDVPTPMSPGFDQDLQFQPSMYNGGFILYIDNLDTDDDYTADISAYNDGLQPDFMPFNGRLSGIWVVEGVPDQGLLISFSEIPGNGNQGLIFLSWYTFDENGNNVWYVGNANYDIGDGTITFELQLVTDGEFLGSKTATRIPAGTVTITARHCNLLELTFDLSDVGLGQATISVVRLEQIETAGFICLDRGMQAP